jgi:hypothetical protein
LMRQANLRALHGYRVRRWAVGKPSVLIPSLLKRQFTAARPNVAWVADITFIRTWQGWLYLAVVMDLSPHDRKLGSRTNDSPRARAQCGLDGGAPAPTARDTDSSASGHAVRQ